MLEHEHRFVAESITADKTSAGTSCEGARFGVTKLSSKTTTVALFEGGSFNDSFPDFFPTYSRSCSPAERPGNPRNRITRAPTGVFLYFNLHSIDFDLWSTMEP